MKIANIEIFKNKGGTISMQNTEDNYSEPCAFPVELIPTIIKALQIVYEKSNKSSDIIYDEE